MTDSFAPGPRPHSTEAGFFRFCPQCATAMVRVQWHGRLRPRCPACGFIQWRNPGVGVAGILREDELVARLGIEALRRGLDDPAWEPLAGAGRVLLVRRRDVRHPGWCLPCGWVEYDEEIRSALRRELVEETGVEADPEEIFAVQSNFHEPDRQSVGIWFRCRPSGGSLRPGDDADRVRFVLPGQVDVPLAFPTDHLVMDRLRG